MKENRLKVVDLFAGAGGFSLGFELAGFDVSGALEIDKWAGETFQLNHPNAKVLIKDITQLSDSELENTFESPDIVLGGPPCQGFSVCVKNAGDPKNPRNSLFMEFIRAVRVLSPKIVIMENVPNLIEARTIQGDLVIDLIVRELTELGYAVKYQIIEAVKYGVPQIRKRLFVIGSRIPLETYFPKPTHESNRVSLWDAISDLPELNAAEGSEIMDYKNEPLNSYQALMRVRSKKLHNHVAMKHSKRMVKRFQSMQWGESVADVPDELKPFARGKKGVISKKTYDQNNRRMHPNKPCHTIPASFYANFVHPYKHRNFTAREGARIQSFPDQYKFYGKPTVVSHKLLEREGRGEEKHLCQYNQIGNAVPPLLAKAIALNIKRQLVLVQENVRSR